MALARRGELEPAEDPTRRRVEVRQQGGRLDQNGELVAADPERHVRRNGAGNASRSDLNQPVACKVPEGVVHDLQIVQIAHEQRSEEKTSELQSLMRHSYAVSSLKQKNTNT